ncbi:MAG: transposase [Gallionellaceae bacterium]|nr:MAG: transposase [Gallionellaceae bacterium]
MKVHIGVDSRSGLVHSASVTSANVYDSRELPNLLHRNETRLYGDSAYTGQKDVLKEAAPKAKTSPTSAPAINGRRQGYQSPEVTGARQGRASVPPLQGHPWICQGTLLRSDKEREPRLCAVGANQHREMGATSYKGSPSCVGRMGEKSPENTPVAGCKGRKRAMSPMKKQM